ncbi:N-6 DNA methylase [Candidatus Nitrosacidococcus sp. I8]|uniref:N-6 DNA methylase n=1 Tax=Candidatus Nitrosacidococcus sp. I8 TaxID=2942908 RepID=UPI002225D473|nr:N-6 DNA methylase [Candidatus Nitrosacidococcus sp. I8]CAH9018596.1 hypothetical protein NURINAE_01017 [Candidatus Nitrosacidococcus sp. I8]
MRAEGIHTPEGKQKIIIELYDKFFRNAFPKRADRLGIVYTPIEVVAFIIHSLEAVLQDQFNKSMADDEVHIMDPFTGTGTFITRLLQSGIIPQDRLAKKYRTEIHANEIVLLAYYLAAINIEATYHGILGGDYTPFEEICLTDTFQMNEHHAQPDWVHATLAENNTRRCKQQSLKIKVIMGNPPYSAGQKSANDNNANLAYENLDTRVRNTYARLSTATNKNALYDSYVRAIRWASDRIGDQGVIGFVTNGSFIEGNAMDGLRKCLASEFSHLYIFHLRGNIRKNMGNKGNNSEGQNIFGNASVAPIAISILVKNPIENSGKIYFYDKS